MNIKEYINELKKNYTNYKFEIEEDEDDVFLNIYSKNLEADKKLYEIYDKFINFTVENDFDNYFSNIFFYINSEEYKKLKTLANARAKGEKL